MSPEDTALKKVLDEVRAQCNVAERREIDPVGLVHRYEDPLDQELVGLVAASVAFGNVAVIRAKLGDALARVGTQPKRAAESPKQLEEALHGWTHRVFRGEDIAKLFVGARRVQRNEGTLGQRFARDFADTGSFREALAVWCDRLREAGGLGADGSGRRGPMHLLTDPRGPSGSKRLLLYARWMVRRADGVDLGLWPVEPRHLVCPVDTHIHRLSTRLGLTQRKDKSWKTAEEITRGLARLDPEDPVKYDFALCHLGMQPATRVACDPDER